MLEKLQQWPDLKLFKEMSNVKKDTLNKFSA